MNRYAFVGLVPTPKVSQVLLEEESKFLDKIKTTAAYVFESKKSANKFIESVSKFVKSCELTEDVGEKEKTTFKVRLKLEQNNKDKNKNTMKIVNLAQHNNSKIDIKEMEELEDMVEGVFYHIWDDFDNDESRMYNDPSKDYFWDVIPEGTADITKTDRTLKTWADDTEDAIEKAEKYKSDNVDEPEEEPEELEVKPNPKEDEPEEDPEKE